MIDILDQAEAFNASAKRERDLWAARDDAEMDVRIAKRSGDEAAISDATTMASAAGKTWHEAHIKAQAELKMMLEMLNVDPAVVRRWASSL